MKYWSITHFYRSLVIKRVCSWYYLCKKSLIWLPNYLWILMSTSYSLYQQRVRKKNIFIPSILPVSKKYWVISMNFARQNNFLLSYQMIAFNGKECVYQITKIKVAIPNLHSNNRLGYCFILLLKWPLRPMNKWLANLSFEFDFFGC